MQMRYRPDPSTAIRSWLPAGYLALLFLLVVLGVGSIVNVNRIIDHASLVRHTVEVQRTLEEIQADVFGAEGQQRGYLITRDPSYLPEFEVRKKEAMDQLAYLRQLVQDHPRQTERARLLEAAVQERLARLDGVLDLAKRKGIDVALGQVGIRGPELMRQVRTLVSEMLATESKLLDARSSMRDASIRQAAVTFTISALLTLGLLSGLYVLLRRFLSDQLQARTIAEEHRRELQIQIQEKERAERELQRSNRELQDFAFVASHDLQEPLRKIQAFGDRLRAKNLDKLDETSLDYLQRMQNAANRMQELINALLDLSRITTKAQPFVKIDLEKVMSIVLEDLQRRIEESGGEVVVGSLPTIEADRVQIRQLLQNLVANALKFRAEGRAPRVEVRQVASEDPDVVRIVVKDNGIGFEPRHADKIFAVFQRLHGRGEYEGSGIGLAICRRIVDRHGGKIVADSTPGEGATFTIDLPLTQPEATT